MPRLHRRLRRHAARRAAWPVSLLMAVGSCTAGAAAPAGEPAPPATPPEIVAYRESGEWDRDITAVVDRARAFLERSAGEARRPALVLDVDDTSLSNYDCLKAVGFSRERSPGCGRSGDSPAVPQTLELFRAARARGVTVFFVTGRREALRRPTARNLRLRGYRGYERLIMRPDGQPRSARDGWKAGRRRAITRRGHLILVNLGDQRSDLDGGWAVRRYKLPNPMYVIPEA